MTLSTRLLPHTVTLTPFLGNGSYGPEWGDPVEVRARVVTKRQLVRGSAGDELISESTVLLPAGTACAPESLIRLPGETADREVLTYAAKTGARAEHHVEVTTK